MTDNLIVAFCLQDRVITRFGYKEFIQFLRSEITNLNCDLSQGLIMAKILDYLYIKDHGRQVDLGDRTFQTLHFWDKEFRVCLNRYDPTEEFNIIAQVFWEIHGLTESETLFIIDTVRRLYNKYYHQNIPNN